MSSSSVSLMWFEALNSAVHEFGSKLMHHSARTAVFVHDLVKCRRRTSASGLLQQDSWPRPSTFCIFDDFDQNFRQKISKIKKLFSASELFYRLDFV